MKSEEIVENFFIGLLGLLVLPFTLIGIFGAILRKI